ncbi:MAG: hypothetical protein U9N36_00155 [Euryarchaeota archaeon]|nr:hypothetical protein [Euryarchaeota archaeon]
MSFSPGATPESFLISTGTAICPFSLTAYNFRNYSGMLIGLPIAILYFLARKITAEGAEER